LGVAVSASLHRKNILGLDSKPEELTAVGLPQVKKILSGPFVPGTKQRIGRSGGGKASANILSNFIAIASD